MADFRDDAAEGFAREAFEVLRRSVTHSTVTGGHQRASRAFGQGRVERRQASLNGGRGLGQ